MKKYILSIDQGTTGSTALIIDHKSHKVIAKENIEFKQIYPKPGLVEHNLNDIWDSVRESIIKAFKKSNITKNEIYCIGITNQRETTCAYNTDGEPLANAIVWQDRRTSEFCKDKSTSYKDLQKKTGLPLDPYFSATKMRWLLDNNEKVKIAKENNNLLLSTIDSYILYKLSNHKEFKTEGSNASRTLLMNIDNCQWDKELLDFFDIDKSFLPSIEDSFTHFGVTENLDFLPDGIPITCILGDQQAALFGQAGHDKGSLKCTYGTGAFILLNTGKTKHYSSNGLLTTVAYTYKNEPVYALEGAAYIAGAAVQWLRDNLKIIKNSSDIEALAKKVTNFEQMEYLVFLPFFTGIGSPYWNSEAKGSILGLTRDTSNEHIALACLEGMALSINDSIQALTSDFPGEVNEIRVDGGACANDLLMQLQANFSDKKIIRPKVIETTAYGVALGSLIGLGEISFSEIDDLWKEDIVFTAKRNSYEDAKLSLWNKSIKKLYL